MVPGSHIQVDLGVEVIEIVAARRIAIRLGLDDGPHKDVGVGASATYHKTRFAPLDRTLQREPAGDNADAALAMKALVVPLLHPDIDDAAQSSSVTRREPALHHIDSIDRVGI